MTLIQVTNPGYTATVHAPGCGKLRNVKPSNKCELRGRSFAEVFSVSWRRPAKCCLGDVGV